MAEAKKTTSEVKVPTAAKAPASSPAVKKAAEKAPAKKATSKFNRPVFDLTGKEVGTVELPKEVFGIEVNRPLLLQALRVYQANQHQGTSSTKTRAEVRGGGHKPWKQKGTGRARAGSSSSPIWRGGGIVHGPQPRDISLDLPAKMRRAALRSALAARVEDVVVVSTFKTKEPKTKQISEGLKKLDLVGKKLLFVLPDADPQVVRASRNLSKVSLTKVQDLNACSVLYSGKLVLSKDALNSLPGVKKEDNKESNDDAN